MPVVVMAKRTGTGSGHHRGAIVLLVDSDLGFVFWLGQALDVAGYVAVPARDIGSAEELVQAHRIEIDILVIDPRMPGALPFISRSRERGKSLKVVAALAQEDEGDVPANDADMVLRKPERFTQEAKMQWIGQIQDLTRTLASAGKS